LTSHPSPSAVSIEQKAPARIGYPGDFLISHSANLFLGQVTSALQLKPHGSAQYSYGFSSRVAVTKQAWAVSL